MGYCYRLAWAKQPVHNWQQMCTWQPNIASLAEQAVLKSRLHAFKRHLEQTTLLHCQRAQST